MRRRKADFVAHLVIIDEPQLFLLKAKKVNFLALAIPKGVVGDYDYVAVTVTDRNLQRYADGFVDTRYLFTYPVNRLIYSFCQSDWNENNVMLTPFNGVLPERALPNTGLFSDSHTEDFFEDQRASHHETLLINGEWELDDFGRFYRKYSDIYYVTAALDSFTDTLQPNALKGRTKKAFSDKPYKGGTSYMHMFSGLNGCIPRNQRLGLEGINYNSPGDVKILGDTKKLSDVEVLMVHFLENRKNISEAHKSLRDYISKAKLLKKPAEEYSSANPFDSGISERTERLVEAMNFVHYDNLKLVCDQNTLVISKVMLAIFRRIDAASAFFAEGRMSFK